MERILIRHDYSAEQEFMKGLNSVVSRGKELIRLFNNYQPFKSIKMMQDFVALLSDPVNYYDSILIDNVQHDSRLSVNAQKLADLYSIPRTEYLLGLGMTKDQASKCQSCKDQDDMPIKLKVLDMNEYISYSKFLGFKNGELLVNAVTVEKLSNEFDVYASNKKSVDLVKHYKELCKVLNDAIKYHKLGPVQVQALAKMFNFQILDNQLVLNELFLAEKIKYLS